MNLFSSLAISYSRIILNSITVGVTASRARAITAIVLLVACSSFTIATIVSTTFMVCFFTWFVAAVCHRFKFSIYDLMYYSGLNIPCEEGEHHEAVYENCIESF
ncbi:hypothetical protein D1872_286310 [compost metagenome]